MNNVINFYKVNEPYGCFSNFSPHSILIDGVEWPTSEHYFQAQKFSDSSIQEKIRISKSPMEAALLGRRRDFPLRSDWEQIKDDVMRKAVLAKMSQHKDVRELLVQTEQAVLVEHTKNDHYWGDGGDGTGKNMLGRILMEIRASLKK
jgi:N-glycosidase YbiA